MDTNRLRYFSVISRTGSLARAAELLRVSPPALSKAMGVLQEELGTRLFVPAGRGLALSEEGKRLLPEVEKLLESIEHLRRKRGGAAMALATRLRLGSFEVFSTYCLGPILEEGFPDMSLDLHELVPGELETALVEGRIDVGVTYLPIPRPELEYLRIASVRMGVFGLPDRFPKPDLETLPFVVPILPIRGTPSKVDGLDGWPDDRLPRLQRFRVALMESAMQICRRGLGVAYLPAFVVALHNRDVKESARLRELTIPGVPAGRQEVYLVRRKGAEEDRVVKRLAKVLRGLVSEAK